MLCAICKEDLPESEFYKNRSRLMRHCKRCHYVKTRRTNADLTNEERLARNAKARARRNPGIGTSSPNVKVCRSLHPTETRSRDVIKDRVRRGRMIRPCVCEVCGEAMTAEFAHAHHVDYGRALYVVWCHDACHRAVHSGEMVIPESSLRVASDRELEQSVRLVVS
jgi:hypothetical protein